MGALASCTTRGLQPGLVAASREIWGPGPYPAPMPLPDFRWFSVVSRPDKLPDAIYRGMTEVLRPSQRLGDEVWWVEGVLTTVAARARVTSGYTPSARRFSLPPKRYFSRHQRPPAGEISR